ncbi:40S ribosomal protein S7 isoform X1 [Thrips palmi]|uniref:40S ribosomal protein S7 n=2 Tax=Thrips palmi TaxID=161013 RepID=A0A6P8Z5P2_THRPL|nr:40S ribosomal protein S7 isoform X1 [Thrips palmi]
MMINGSNKKIVSNSLKSAKIFFPAYCKEVCLFGYCFGNYFVNSQPLSNLPTAIEALFSSKAVPVKLTGSSGSTFNGPFTHSHGKMIAAGAKILKPGGAEPDAFEVSISQALMELEMNSDLKAQLRELHITKAKEIELNGKKSIIIYVPIPQLKLFQKIQTRLVRELEKKFSGKHVVFVGERKILPKPTRKTRTQNKQKRPRSRTLTAVYDSILEDLVFPAEIVGKRIRVKLDGSQLIKVHLDKNQQTNIEHKVDTFASVYKKLTGREVSFEFPEPYL